ncbi:Inositol-1,4,5-trisphosphate 5-phosphatase 1 [Coemansia sp. RSA 2706]|nr:Inositol-1,4,5-trisphosphate 5-phosphatase 1 [Coemansia sp. RSA 2706]
MSNIDARRFFVHVSSQPRAIALVPTHALSDPNGTFLSLRIRRTHPADPVRVELTVEKISSTLQHYSPLDIDAVFGCAGILDYQGDTFVFLVTRCQLVCDLAALNPRQDKPVFRVVQVLALSLTDSIFDSQAVQRMPGAMYDDVTQGEMDIYGVTNPCAQMASFLANGAFYFSPAFDITRTMQSQQLSAIAADDPRVNEPDAKFQWNSKLLQVFADFRLLMCGTRARQQFDAAGYVLSLIQGAVESLQLPQSIGAASQGQQAGIACYLISRTSSMRSGMRFLTRGVDDEGGVANEVETELVLTTPSLTLSHVQVRGSVPAFWTQEGLQLGTHKVRITRSVKATLPATKRHFSDLLDRYKRVSVVSLLRLHSTPRDYGGLEAADPGMVSHGVGTSEADLGRFYRVIIESMELPESLLSFHAFDYNQEVRGGQFDRVHVLIRQLAPLLASFKYYLLDNDSQTVLSFQRGVQRTNCIDCLDRTNVVQSVISRAVVSEFLRQTDVVRRHMLDPIVDSISRLWAANGNAISRAYAGTGALKSDVTTSGKSGWAGFLSDASKSLSRLMQSSFQDRGKQSVIDVLLGSGDSCLVCRPVQVYDPYANIIAPRLEQELHKIARKSALNLMLCTYNLHGCPYRGESLGRWLAMSNDRRPDIVAIGFQEVVNLDVQSVIAADTANRRTWEQVLTAEINSQYLKSFGDRADGEFALVSSEQLVGVSLLLFAHDTALSRIHNVQMVKCKTGLAGMTGNKGCVALHMMLDDSSICIVSAHLAAGNSNVSERNNDYHTIRTNTRFQHLYIDSHDYVFWIGDLNYRLNLPNEQVRPLAAAGRLSELLEHDQLQIQMANGQVFGGYSEAAIRFPPTYKYDSGTTRYDTSEKMRVPSWTDRILYKGRNVRVQDYYRDELCFSDHKPVLAQIQIDVVAVDKQQKRQIMRQLYSQLHAADGTASTNVQRLIDMDMPSAGSASSMSTVGRPSLDSRGASIVSTVNAGNPLNGVAATGRTPMKPANMMDDPFADDDDGGIAWKPIVPS